LQCRLKVFCWEIKFVRKQIFGTFFEVEGFGHIR